MSRLGTPLSPTAVRVMLLGSGELGKEVILLSYPGENHGLAKPANMKDYARRMDEFFDAKLMGDFVTARGSIGNRCKDAIDDLAGIGLGQAIGFGNLLGEVSIVHVKWFLR